jgi:3-isopropylmalate/(R)-2-methylmalate dehydratase small subunit
MQPFISLTAIAAPYYFPDIDTDKLIPHRFLRKPLSAGYRNFLFYDQRFTPEGKEKAGFILDRDPYRRAKILVTGDNFGCGSTREGAVYALYDFGFRAIIAPGFGDIFKSNCLQNGLLPVVLQKTIVENLSAHLEQNPGTTVAIDLDAQSVTTPDGLKHHFDIDLSRKEQLLEGLDDIGITLKHSELIDQFEKRYRSRMPWLGRSA